MGLRALRGLPQWSRDLLRQGEAELLSRGSRFKPAVFRLPRPDGKGACIVKDCRPVPAWSRPLARWLMRREARLLARLSGLEGFPPPLATIDADAFAVAQLPGEPLSEERFRSAPRELAEQLRGHVERMHERGVYHLDLRQRQNLLVDADGRLQVIDFGAGMAPWGPCRWLFGPLLAVSDRQAALKYLARFAPEEMSVAEARSFLRFLRWRKAWFLSPYRDNGEAERVRAHLQRADVGA